MEVEVVFDLIVGSLLLDPKIRPGIESRTYVCLERFRNWPNGLLDTKKRRSSKFGEAYEVLSP